MPLQALPGYQLQEKIHHGTTSVLYRAWGEREAAPVILKTSPALYPPPEELAVLEHEYEVGRRFDADGLVRALALVPHGKSYVLVMEDFGARSLADFLVQHGPLAPALFLELAQAITRAVGALHRRDVIHKDICPANLFYNPTTGQVKLGDFGTASGVAREKQEFHNPALIVGTLAYLPPEQSGRMNRAIDHRADLYALGATFYHLLTGTVPFETQDAVELIHCHIARMPPPPHQRRPGVPEVLSALVLKLLAKNAEDRYQGADGLLADLAACARGLRETGQVPASLRLGEQDLPGTLRISEKLYGREAPLAALLEAFERTAAGQLGLLVVDGPSGVGKSAVVREVHKSLAARRGYFAQGKCDQLATQGPRSVFAQVLADLVRQILTESEERLARWRLHLLDVLGGNGQLLFPLVPELELVIGPQPPPLELPPAEARDRFETLVVRTLLAFSSDAHPLVLFLDDLQWVQPASLRFLSLLLTHPLASHLLVIAAYRGNEVPPAHPLRVTLAELEKGGLSRTHLHLEPLGLAHVTALLADTLRSEPAPVVPLAEQVLEKTGGNPFFVTQLLQTLHDVGILRFDAPERRWMWDLERLHGLGVSDSVVDFMVDKLRRYSPDVRRSLLLASGLGSTFDLGTLALITRTPPREQAHHLWEALRDGLLLALDNRYQYYLWSREDRDTAPPPEEVRYRFAHDRIQEAAHAQATPEERARLSLEAGRLLRDGLPPEQRPERLFNLVNHLNLGSALMDAPEERIELARLDLEAARQAKAATAYQSAVDYLRAGLALLPGDAWEGQYELMFGLHRELTECAYLSGRVDEAERVFALTVQRARTLAHQGDIYQLMSRILQTLARVREGLWLGQECLRLFGLELPEEPERAQAVIRERTARLEELIGGRPLDTLVDGPLMGNEELATCLVLLHETWACAIMVGDLTQQALTALHMMILSLEHGSTAYSACGYVAWGMVLTTRGEHARAYDFGRLAMALNQRFKNPLVTPKVNNTFANFVNHYTDHVRTNVPIYTESYQYAQKSGDRWWGAWAATWLWTARYLKGDPLPEVYETGALYLGYVRDSGYAPLYELLRMEQHALRVLQGREEPPEEPPGAFEEAAVVERFEGLGFALGTHIYYALETLGHVLHGRAREALRTSDAAHRLKDHIPFLMPYPSHFLYRSLALAAAHAEADEPQRQEWRREMAEHLERMRGWAAHGPANYQHQALLIAAELARLEGRLGEVEDLYEAAIASAHDGGFLHHEALANELAGAHQLARGRPRAARGYYQEARYLYSRWGATPQVARLEARFRAQLAATTGPGSETTTTSRLWADRLDLATVMKATQALSGEIVLGRLLERIVRICMENAGARRGVLVLERDGRLFVEASAGEEDAEVRVHQALPLEQSEELPRSVLQYVQRTGKVVVLDKASEDTTFRHDPYLASREVRSVLCLPAVGNARRRGILYLENNLTVGAFTPERTRVLQLLATQAAISLENAVLYETLEQRVESRTHELQEKNTTLANTLSELRETQDRMILQSRLAALGSLTAGIAHELRNPLNFVNNFSKLTVELAEELRAELEALSGLPPSLNDALHGLSADIQTNLDKVVEHGTRASRIIGSMLEHARGTPGERVQTDINLLIREYAALSYQAMRSRHAGFNVTLRMELDESLGEVKVAQHELGRVLLNLMDNACFAVHARQRTAAPGYAPEILCRSRDLGERMELRVRDNGTGIPAHVRERIFEPFFTTKPPGEGTGLGLSLSREIIEQGNGGTLRMETEEDVFTEFIVTLPRRGPA